MDTLRRHRTAHIRALRNVLLTLVIVVPLAGMTAGPVSAQPVSPLPGIGNGVPTTRPDQLVRVPRGETPPGFTRSLILSSVGSAVGSLAGLAVGYGTGDASAMLMGVTFGSVAGAGGGATLAGAKGSVALGGALVGAAVGYGAVVGLNGAGSPWLTFALVQGLVTTLIAR